MKLHQIIILLSFATCIPFNFLSMFEPSSTVSFSPTENAYEKNYSQRKSKYDTNSFDAARGLYDDPIYQPKINDAIKAQEIERAQKLASERKETAVTEKQNKSTSPTPAQQELLLQEVALYETTTPPLTNNKTELLNNAPYNATNKTHNNLTFIDNNMNSSEPDTSEMINSQKNNGEIFLSEQVSEQFPQFKKDTSKVSILTDIDTAQEKPGIIAQKVTKEFNRFINNQLFTLIKKTFNLNANLSGAQLSLANIIIKSLAQFAFQLFHIPQHFGTQKDTSIRS